MIEEASAQLREAAAALSKKIGVTAHEEVATGQVIATIVRLLRRPTFWSSEREARISCAISCS